MDDQPISIRQHATIDYLLLADFIQQTADNRLHCIGIGWNHLSVADFNQPVRLMAGICFAVPWIDRNRAIPWTVTVRDSDGVEISPRLENHLSAMAGPIAAMAKRWGFGWR